MKHRLIAAATCAAVTALTAGLLAAPAASAATSPEEAYRVFRVNIPIHFQPRGLADTLNSGGTVTVKYSLSGEYETTATTVTMSGNKTKIVERRKFINDWGQRQTVTYTTLCEYSRCVSKAADGGYLNVIVRFSEVDMVEAVTNRLGEHDILDTFGKVYDNPVTRTTGRERTTVRRDAQGNITAIKETFSGKGRYSEPGRTVAMTLSATTAKTHRATGDQWSFSARGTAKSNVETRTMPSKFKVSTSITTKWRGTRINVPQATKPIDDYAIVLVPYGVR